MTYEKEGLFVEDAQLERYAENLARTWKISAYTDGKADAAALRRALRKLQLQHDSLLSRNDAGGAVQWVLDNHYLARREGICALSALQHMRRMRQCGEGSLLLLLCRALLRSGRCTLNEERISLFLRGVQKTLVLERSELDALRAGLTTALVESLTKLCSEITLEGAETQAKHIFDSLRWLGTADLTALLDAADVTEQILQCDPAGIYPSMSKRSRLEYRRRLALLAARASLPERMAAQHILSLAKQENGLRAHVGYWLYDRPLGEKKRESRGGIYIAVIILLSLFLSLLPAFVLHSPVTAALLLLPVSEIVKRIIDAIAVHSVAPVHLPRLALDGGVPDEGRTLCVISALLTDENCGPSLAARLEQAHLVSRDAGRNLRFALLADLPETGEELLPQADLWISAAKDAVDALNEKYGGGFYLLSRPRRRTHEGKWSAWERKRGALLESMRMLRGSESSISVLAGDADALSGTRFLLALDSDSTLAPGTAKALISAALHPMNCPVIDESRGVVRRGYGIFAPRIGTALESAFATDFARAFAGQGGTDPYCGESSELYMDLFHRGCFAGKGLIDIDAYLVCMGNRVPENRMLSHDAVESAFLRTGFLSDAEVTDGFPCGVCAWLRRLERWTRGDWQNLPWLFRQGRALADIERWKLFDSLRRSVLPLSALAAMILAVTLPSTGSIFAAGVTLLALTAELMQVGAETLLLPERDAHVRYHSALLVGLGGALVRTLLRLILLPAEALICLGAALRALWRMLFSHRHLLDWQTSAQSERRRSGLSAVFAMLWPASLIGLLLTIFAQSIPGHALGVIWLLSPLCAWLLSLPASAATPLSTREQEQLREYARETWRYFDEFMTAYDHFLPPDNAQIQPPVGLAHRTSPTNIGLALLSLLAAIDLGFAEKSLVFDRIAACLKTVEKLEKWHGHLLNWYDTRSLAPLTPRYVSTVDSGNLCAALTALSAGLLEHGRPDLAAMASVLADAMDFAPLYDRHKQLFYIGRDPDKNEPDSSWYDLMASEARLTAYLTVARGDVPREHWRALSRAQVQLGPYRGLVSWTGTSFEYLMPELLLPVQRGSLLWESARFCLYAQRRRTSSLRLPWGCSESAYASLDPSMTYRYKAHGCGALALKRGMDEELVVAPYSSFLALAIRPKAALRNLLALENYGMRGPYGFWEALDFTPPRCTPEGSTVRCVMAHHQAMSLIAAANALCGNIMQRRFFAQPDMAAYRGLLQERVILGGSVLRRSEDAARRGNVPQADNIFWERTGTDSDHLHPACCMLASETYSLLYSETGISRALWGDISPYVPGENPLSDSKGIDLILYCGGHAHSLLPEPYVDAAAQVNWQFSTSSAWIESTADNITARCSVSVATAEIGEVREISLSATELSEAELALRFRPLLARYVDYVNHPAFLGLGLSAKVRDGSLLLRRIARGDTPELWLCLTPSQPCIFDLAPGAASGRAAKQTPASKAEVFFADPLVTARCPLRIPANETLKLRFALALAYTEDDALESAHRILRAGEAAEFPRKAAAVLGITPNAIDSAFSLLSELSFPKAAHGAVRQSDLWPFGISGDLPILCADYSDEAQLPAAKSLMDAYLFLSGCGANFDLVFLSCDGAGYHKPLKTALTDLLRRTGGEILRDRRGGVHLIEAEPRADCIRNAAAICIDLSAPAPVSPRDGYYLAKLPRHGKRPPFQNPVRYEWDKDGTFRFYVNQSLPQRAWQNMLCNNHFGYLATDCGTGHLWYRNAREHQITPWLCQPSDVFGPERLMLETGGVLHSLFATADDGVCRVNYDFGTAVWERRFADITVRTTAFVPPDTAARVLIIECDAPAEDTTLHWQMDLQLAPSREDARFCRTGRKGDFLIAANPRQIALAAPFLAITSPPMQAFTCSRANAFALEYNDEAQHRGEPVFALKLHPNMCTVLVCGCDTPEKLRSLSNVPAAQEALAQTRAHWRSRCGALQLSSPHAALDRLFNGWAAYQTLACRLMGRCSIYQSGGAFGFRDQLQDAANLILLDPDLCRSQILHACSHQYAEGDVQHWWHEGDATAKGVRTHCSDDLLWLPWAVAEYVERSGDLSILDADAPYLISAPLAVNERDRYESPEQSESCESVYAHGLRALRCVMVRGTGAHGLLHIGSGDWNDGFDAVDGESVWLSWFFLAVTRRFAALRPLPGTEAAELKEFCDDLRAALDAAWDGTHYLRGRYADGTPLGSNESPECRIDSIAQSWAVLSGCGDREKADMALNSALAALYDRDNHLIKLFTPPFSNAENPGYIRSYGPGFRENGGQYTHGALWLVSALARVGRTEEAWELLAAMLPGDRDVSVYLGEPFVLAADVYSAPGHEGEAGWTWYTGSSGWFFRIVAEDFLGLHLRGGRLFIEPNLPPHWNGCRIIWHGHRIEINAGEITVDGRPYTRSGIA